MRIYKADDTDVCRIDFCCKFMAEDILLGVVTTRQWTDHPLGFFVKDSDQWDGYRLSYCGHCGAKIEGEVFGERYYTEEGRG